MVTRDKLANSADGRAVYARARARGQARFWVRLAYSQVMTIATCARTHTTKLITKLNLLARQNVLHAHETGSRSLRSYRLERPDSDDRCTIASISYVSILARAQTQKRARCVIARRLVSETVCVCIDARRAREHLHNVQIEYNTHGRASERLHALLSTRGQEVRRRRQARDKTSTHARTRTQLLLHTM